MKDLLNIDSNLIVLHHRKASYGGDTLTNLHPIKYNNKLYVHNGTALIDGIRGWLELTSSYVPETETDTEILSLIYNELTKLFKTKEEIYESLTKIFPLGWGVLIEIDEFKNITVIKDNLRELWIYKNKNGITFISEPTPYIDSFDTVIKLDSGIFNIMEDDLVGTNYTAEVIEAKRIWTKENAIINEKVTSNCDKCKSTNIKTIASYDTEIANSKDDLCFNCLVKELHKPKVEPDNTSNILELYEAYLE
jgi:glucosamine 6-phosphate synthetase-like amidotransferase/phosphosugar isomerase protein